MQSAEDLLSFTELPHPIIAYKGIIHGYGFGCSWFDVTWGYGKTWAEHIISIS